MRIENRVAHELERVAVQRVASGLGDDVYNAAGVAAILGAIVAGLYAELLERIREWERLVDVGIEIVVVGAVEPEADLVLARAVGGNGHDARKCFRVALIHIVGGRRNGSSHDQKQRRGVAAIEREVDHFALFDNLAEGGRSGVDLRDLAGDGNSFRRLADAESRVHCNALVGEKGHTFLSGLAETGRGRCDVIRGRLERGDSEVALRIAGLLARLAGGRVGDDNFRSGNYSAGWIGDGADDGTETLSKGERGCHEQQEQQTHIIFTPNQLRWWHQRSTE